MNIKFSLVLSASLSSFIAAVAASGCGSDEAAQRPEITDGGDGSGGSGGVSGGGSGGGGAPTGPSVVGRRCLQDSECATGLTCITQDSTGPLFGGIQGGLCTAQCSSDLDCTRLDANSLCAPYDDGGTPRDTSDDSGVCVETCLPGSTDIKCNDRVEMACYAIAVDLGMCLPTCTSDYNCEPRVCDLSSGFCIDAADRPAGGLPIGSACDPTSVEDQCAGYCVDTQDGSGLCTSDCNLGGLVSATGCGTDPRSPEVDALCYYAGADDALGDVGLCAELCDCDDDCARSDMVCDAMPTQIQQLTGHVGACFVANPDVDGGTMGIPCGAGGDAGPSTAPEAGPSPQDAATAADTGASDAP